MTQFIKFAKFIIKKEHIKFARFIDEERQLSLVVSENGEDKIFTMTCDSDYDFRQIFSRLQMDLDAFSIDSDWKHPLIEQVYFARMSVWELDKQLKELTKEFKSLKKYIKSLNNKEEKV